MITRMGQHQAMANAGSTLPLYVWMRETPDWEYRELERVALQDVRQAERRHIGIWSARGELFNSPGNAKWTGDIKENEEIRKANNERLRRHRARKKKIADLEALGYDTVIEETFATARRDGNLFVQLADGWHLVNGLAIDIKLRQPYR